MTGMKFQRTTNLVGVLTTHCSLLVVDKCSYCGCSNIQAQDKFFHLVYVWPIYCLPYLALKAKTCMLLNSSLVSATV